MIKFGKVSKPWIKTLELCPAAVFHGWKIRQVLHNKVKVADN